MSALLGTLVPDGVAVAETTAELDEPLFADEQRAIAAAVPSRRAEYITVRACARRAFAALGEPRPTLAPGPDRAPTWPRGFVGSMTHCEGYRAAAVSRTTALAGLGIDAEPNLALPAGVWELISRADDDFGRLAAQVGLHADRLLFSAKESVFKAWWPLTQSWLEFDDVRVAFAAPEGNGGIFAAFVPTPPGPIGKTPDRLTGRWCANSDHLVTAVTI